MIDHYNYRTVQNSLWLASDILEHDVCQYNLNNIGIFFKHYQYLLIVAWAILKDQCTENVWKLAAPINMAND